MVLLNLLLVSRTIDHPAAERWHELLVIAMLIVAFNNEAGIPEECSAGFHVLRAGSGLMFTQPEPINWLLFHDSALIVFVVYRRLLRNPR